MDNNIPKKHDPGKNGKSKIKVRKDHRNLSDEGPQQKKGFLKEKERGGGSWKQYLNEIDPDLEEEEEDEEF